MQAWLINFGIQHAYLIYVVIVLIALAEGPILSVLLGLVLRLGYFGFIPVYLSLMLGDLIGDVIWYQIGYHYGRRAIAKFGKRFHITEESVDRIEKLFHGHKHKILFISKITNGFGFAIVTLATAGIARVPFWRYLSINFLGQMVWSGVLLAIGYFFGEWYLRTHSLIGRGALVIFFAILFCLVALYSRYLRKKIKK